MPKISDYPQTTTLSVDDLFLVSNSTDGTRTITKANLLNALLNSTVTFDSNGGTGSIDPISVTTGSAIELPDGSELIPPNNEIFCGWAVSPTEKVPNVTSPYTVNDNITLYAIYSKVELKLSDISKDSGSGTLTPSFDSSIFHYYINFGTTSDVMAIIFTALETSYLLTLYTPHGVEVKSSSTGSLTHSFDADGMGSLDHYGDWHLVVEQDTSSTIYTITVVDPN